VINLENAVIQSANQLMELFAVVIFAGLIFGKISELIKMPDVVLFILAGIILGPHILNLVNIDKYPVENQLILSFGAAYILYDGGREIDFKVLNKVKVSISFLSTLGVVISTVIVGYVAMKVFGVTITSSPGLNPMTCEQTCMAVVQFDTAKAYFVPVNAAKSF